jgi:hypothetical protein
MYEKNQSILGANVALQSLHVRPIFQFNTKLTEFSFNFLFVLRS